MKYPPQRAAVTAALLNQLNQLTIPLGYSIAPSGGGFSKGTPTPTGAPFVPYLTLHVGAGQQKDRDTLRGDRAFWALGYLLKAFGATPGQADYTADLARALLAELHSSLIEQPNGEVWEIQQVSLDRFGALVRHDEGETFYEVEDAFSLWLARGR